MNECLSYLLAYSHTTIKRDLKIIQLLNDFFPFLFLEICVRAHFFPILDVIKLIFFRLLKLLSKTHIRPKWLQNLLYRRIISDPPYFTMFFSDLQIPYFFPYTTFSQLLRITLKYTYQTGNI